MASKTSLLGAAGEHYVLYTAVFLCKPFSKEKLRDYIKQCPSLCLGTAG